MSGDAATQSPRTSSGHGWLRFLAVYSFILAFITAIPQFYYVLLLFGLHLVTIGPNTNPLGEVWHWYILSGDSSYRHVDSGILAGAVEDAFLLRPLYLATGLGLWRNSRWVFPVGLITEAMILYAIIGFFLGNIFAGMNAVTNGVSYWATNLPYLVYPLLLLATLLVRRPRAAS
jgi:hypothetical protein